MGREREEETLGYSVNCMLYCREEQDRLHASEVARKLEEEERELSDR